MALDSLSATLSCQLSATGARNITGDDYSPLTQTVSLKGSTRLGTAAANDAANGADECVSFILTIAVSDTGQIDLTDLTDILEQSSVSLVPSRASCSGCCRPRTTRTTGRRAAR